MKRYVCERRKGNEQESSDSIGSNSDFGRGRAAIDARFEDPKGPCMLDMRLAVRWGKLWQFLVYVVWKLLLLRNQRARLRGGRRGLQRWLTSAGGR